MTISYRWLMDYLPVGQAGLQEPLPVDELSRILTSIGLEVEAIEKAEAVKGGLEGLVIGEVLTCAKHPNADKLSVTTVNIGGATPLNIVCGAPNVAAGQRVVVAPPGATVHPTEGAPFQIKKAKIRGEESSGMICAEDEIGLGKSHAGIMVLPADAPIGTSAREYFKIPEPDYTIHIGLTPNRSDANSHIGVARDVCAYLTHHRGQRFAVRLPQVSIDAPANTLTTVTIEAAEACPRYTGLNMTGVKVGPSPEWLQQRLQAIGVRSINNIVDITNYVLHEYGQPLHAFDAAGIAGGTIIVKHLPEGTPFMALDDKERKLLATDLVICDANGPIAMGGVFGGADSGITDATTDIFIESAYFNPTTVRRTSLHHGLRTDAATHFEKGVDINNVLPALMRAAALIAEIAGGKPASAITDVYPTPLQPVTVTVRYDYIRKLAGKNYKTLAIQELLLASGFVIEGETEEQLTLQVPSNKTDVSQPADIVEEILRIDGLDNIAIPSRLNIALTKTQPTDRIAKERMAELLCGMGMQEIVTNSIVNSKYHPDRTDLVRMINSLTSELDVMRPTMLESGLEVIEYNCNRKNQDLALFEFGNVYTLQDTRYIEQPKLAIWLTGKVTADSWNHKGAKVDIYHAKGIVNTLLQYAGINAATASATTGGVEWKWKNQQLCSVQQVPAPKLKMLDVKQDVYFIEINWSAWTKAASAGKIKYTEVPKFPAVARDLAIVLDTSVTYQQVQEATSQLKLDALRSFGLFDVFESDKLGAGKKSYALNYTFQLTDRTLTDTEVEQLMRQLIDTYKSKLNAQIRE